jgi:Trk-type K+ transport system membrane component
MGTKFLFRVKERFFKYYFIVQDFLLKLFGMVSTVCNLVILVCSLLFATLLIARLGFYHHQIVQDNVEGLISKVFIVSYIAKYVHDIYIYVSRKVFPRLIDLLIFLVCTVVLVPNAHAFSVDFVGSSLLSSFPAVATVMGLILVSDFSKVAKVLSSMKMSPPLFFAFSFLVMIFVGSGLLMLPNVHIGKISYFQALFTSASTICVSGLSIIDLTDIMTFKGNVILLFLFQIGGLGVMAFTGLFAFAFTGTVSFKDRILLKDMFSSDTLGDIFSFLAKMLSITLLVETIGAVAIYLSISDSDILDPIFFSIFHSVSAFCNCGISTLSNGFANPIVAENNTLLILIAILTTLGGIGFPVLIALYTTLRNRTAHLLNIQMDRRNNPVRVGSDMATHIAIITTLGILVLGTVTYYFLEIGNTLADGSVYSRWVKSFFCCATARTAGFNGSDISCWSNATMVFIMGIMWVGASPGSTGGGIKTTTFALMLCSIVSFIRGNRYIEIGYHRIGFETISRVLVLVSMSMLIIFAAFILFAFFEPDKNPLRLFFDTVSMYSTTGLSMTGTANLSIPSQVLTMVMMFLGRVGPLTLLSGIFVSRKAKYAKYPYKNLTIN